MIYFDNKKSCGHPSLCFSYITLFLVNYVFYLGSPNSFCRVLRDHLFCSRPRPRLVLISFWRERAAFQRLAFGRSTAGNDVVATIIILQKLLRTPKNLGVDTFPDPVRHFGSPWRPFWVLQVVRRCRR